jgi:hypothetical protein
VSTQTQLNLLGGVLSVIGIGLIALAFWWVYHPLCPAGVGIACLYFGRVAYREANGR